MVSRVVVGILTVAVAARASGFVLQSAEPAEPPKVAQVSYLDSQ